MSNNDLPCSKCGSQHHPVDCPLDERRNLMAKELMNMLIMIFMSGYGAEDEEMSTLCSQAYKEIKQLILSKIPEKEDRDCSKHYKKGCPECAYIRGRNDIREELTKGVEEL